MIDHVSFSVKNYAESLKFYDETLKILGVTRLMNFENGEGKISGYGIDERPSFWIGVEENPNKHESIGEARGLHIAFKANNTNEINMWYQKCIELGGKDNGAPGPRLEYHAGYYGAFIIDPNGWRIEAAIHNYHEV
jgi:catechol 2,3-dioxygenase-like lactoylglutathione lyase family enzyme